LVGDFTGDAGMKAERIPTANDGFLGTRAVKILV